MISAAQPIPLSDAQLIAITQSCYGFVPQIQRLPGEYDTNAVAIHPDGHRFVLKIMHPERDSSFVEMQIAALTHLAHTAASVPVQRVIPQTSGAQWSRR